MHPTVPCNMQHVLGRSTLGQHVERQKPPAKAWKCCNARHSQRALLMAHLELAEEADPELAETLGGGCTAESVSETAASHAACCCFVLVFECAFLLHILFERSAEHGTSEHVLHWRVQARARACTRQ